MAIHDNKKSIQAENVSIQMTVDKNGQKELFEAQTQWFHVFKSMIDNGDMAKLSGSAVKVYLVVKAHTNYSTGRAFPSLETIAEKAGMSDRQVKRELLTLEEFGYITKEKEGRKNLYTLREKIDITDEQGRPQAVATWDYLPSSVQHAVADLKNVLLTGDLAGAKIVHIENLNVRVNNLYDHAQQSIVENQYIQESKFLEDLKELPEGVRKKALKAYRKSFTEEN